MHSCVFFHPVSGRFCPWVGVFSRSLVFSGILMVEFSRNTFFGTKEAFLFIFLASLVPPASPAQCCLFFPALALFVPVGY